MQKVFYIKIFSKIALKRKNYRDENIEFCALFFN